MLTTTPHLCVCVCVTNQPGQARPGQAAQASSLLISISSHCSNQSLHGSSRLGQFGAPTLHAGARHTLREEDPIFSTQHTQWM